MSSRLHNKFHRHNHHTSPPSNNDPRYPDASFDPIASYTVPFNGPFVIQNPNLIAPTTPSTLHTPNIAIDVAGDIAATGNIYAAGQYFGDGSQLALGNNTSLIATVTGTPFVYGASNPVTSIVSSITGTGNSSRAQYSTVAGGSGNTINSSGSFSFIAAGSSNQTNVPNTFILGTNINASLPNYTYVNNLSSLGTIYATTIGASSVNAIHTGDGSLLNLSNNPLSATTTTLVNNVSTTLNASVTSSITSLSSTTTTLVNTVSTTLNASITSLSSTTTTLVNTVSTTLNSTITGLQSLSGNWQSVYSLVNTTTATTFNVKGLSATGLISASAFNASNGFYSTSAFSGTYTDGIVTDYVTGLGRISVGAADALAFYNGGPASTATVMVCANGNVGIGTTVPNQNLTVVGNISATGAVYSTNTGIIGSPTYYVTPTNSPQLTGGPGTAYSLSKPVFTALPSASADYLVANAGYEIEYNLFNYTTGSLGFYFTLSASSTLSIMSAIYASDNLTNITTTPAIVVDGNTLTGVSLLPLPETHNSPNSFNIINIKSYLTTGNNPCYLSLIFNNQTTVTTTGMTILSGSYRKVTRVF